MIRFHRTRQIQTWATLCMMTRRGPAQPTFSRLPRDLPRTREADPNRGMWSKLTYCTSYSSNQNLDSPNVTEVETNKICYCLFFRSEARSGDSLDLFMSTQNLMSPVKSNSQGLTKSSQDDFPSTSAKWVKFEFGAIKKKLLFFFSQNPVSRYNKSSRLKVTKVKSPILASFWKIRITEKFSSEKPLGHDEKDFGNPSWIIYP